MKRAVVAALVAVAAVAGGAGRCEGLEAERKILAPMAAAPLRSDHAPVAAPALVEIGEPPDEGTEAAEESTNDAEAGERPSEDDQEEEEGEGSQEDSADFSDSGEDEGEEESEEESTSEDSNSNQGAIDAAETKEPGSNACAEKDKSDKCAKLPAKIVTSLSHEYRPYKDSGARIGESSGAAALRDLAEEDRNDHGDAVLQGLFKKLIETEDSMKKDRDWVTKVYQLIDHYREKALRVRAAVRHEGGKVYRLEQMIHARQEELANGKLKEKLKNVNAAMTELESKTAAVDRTQQHMAESKELIKQHILRLRHALAKIGAPVYQ